MHLQFTSRLVALAVCLLAVATSRAQADYTFNIAGTFGADIAGTTGLAGGSFAGTYSIPSFSNLDANSEAILTAYQVNLFNAAGGIVYTFNFAPDPPTELASTRTKGISSLIR